MLATSVVQLADEERAFSMHRVCKAPQPRHDVRTEHRYRRSAALVAGMDPQDLGHDGSTAAAGDAHEVGDQSVAHLMLLAQIGRRGKPHDPVAGLPWAKLNWRKQTRKRLSYFRRARHSARIDDQPVLIGGYG